MTISDTPFVPAQEIRRITTGSYEHLIARLEEAVSTASQQWSGGSKATIVGTFPGYALATVPDGRCFRLQYEDKNGLIQVKGATPFPVQTYPSSVDYVKVEARKAVDAFLRGSPVESAERLRLVSRLIEARPADAEFRLMEALFGLFSSERAWKTQFLARKDQFHAFLGKDVIERIQEDLPEPRFSSLYEKVVPEESVTAFSSIVGEALEQLAARLDTHREGVDKASVLLADVASDLVRIGESGVQTALASFARALSHELSIVQREVVESFQTIKRIDCLGKIYDHVVEELEDYEVASRYVVDMTNSLVEAAAQK